MSSNIQFELFPENIDNNHLSASEIKLSRSGTFTDNMKLPIHRWFRYSAGFSAEWVVQVIHEYKRTASLKILDPFAGSGTTLLAADSCHIESVGFESHPFIQKIANIKLHWDIEPRQISHYSIKLLQVAQDILKPTQRLDNSLLERCYTEDYLKKLTALREAYFALSEADDPYWNIIWLGITGILRTCSKAGTAQWQYVLPNKQKTNVLEPFEAFKSKIAQIISDIHFAQNNRWKERASILLTDARYPDFQGEEIFDLVITSPPYPNNYDYADATRLEMTFWGEVTGWKDLQLSVRQYLVRSCSQHAAAEKLQLDDLLQEDILSPIHLELSEACQKLAQIRLNKGGRKTYHTMAAAYFKDLSLVFFTLRRLCKKNALVCFVIGDSAPYGVYLPVDQWLGKLALSAGFKSFTFEKIRDRNIKWKNRKHNVPLHEGRLWIKG
jgi:DNA modification methylase